jgi:RimJ/RimL family protein N-acetyltransferase
MTYLLKALGSIRKRGLKLTFLLAFIKAKSYIDLLLPKTIWGSRIGLRPVACSLTEAQIERVYQWNIDEEILRWSAAAPTRVTLDEFRSQLRLQRWRPQSDRRSFYIVTRTNELIGKVTLDSIDWVKGEGEVGIILDKQYWSQHYGREALQILQHYVFSKTPINRIHLGTFNDNLRAQRSFAACGFRVVGVRGHYNPVLGQYSQGVAMEITRQDFREQNSRH